MAFATNWLPSNCRLEYPANDQANDAELVQLEEQVNTKGLVLLWSNVLADFVAFYRNEGDLQKIPDWFVPYSKEELWELFREGESGLSPTDLRLGHEARKQS